MHQGGITHLAGADDLTALRVHDGNANDGYRRAEGLSSKKAWKKDRQWRRWLPFAGIMLSMIKSRLKLPCRPGPSLIMASR